MPPFVLLSDPARYRPCAENMLHDEAFRAYWLGHFPRHFAVIAELALQEYGAHRRADIEACHQDLRQTMAALAQTPGLYGELDLLVLDVIRQQKLRAYDIPDPFEKQKRRENAAALAVYPRVVAELDAHDDGPELLRRLVEGIFAGNIFDMGAGATATLFASSSPDFIKVRDSLDGKRPWLIDQFDAFAQRLVAGPRHRKAVFFLDNAGSDAVLGVLPFVRYLARRGTATVVAANRLPALNDVTCCELLVLFEQVAAVDDTFAGLLKDGLISGVDSGGIAPLIDLRHVSEAVNAAAADADLVLLEGMGRALESNFDAAFTVDAVKLCMIKEEIVAQRRGGKVFDTVIRFDAA